MLSLKRFFLASLCFCLASPTWAQQEDSSQAVKEELPAWEQEAPLEKEEYPTLEQKPPSEKEEFLTRGEKTVLLNTGSMVAIFIYGLLKWDYGKETFHFENERWFQRDTKSGGADKLGHVWTSYTLSHFYSYLYRKWGYTDKEANLYGSLSSLGANTFMEVADGFSSQGFSYEDMLMNLVGVGVGYAWGKYPNLARKIDLRIEYTPKFDRQDFSLFTNYERQRFLIALKADGFDVIKNPYLRYLELHVGYYGRGYQNYEEGGPDNRRRNIYVGLGFNVSRLVQKVVDTRVFDYIQIPYTSVFYKFGLD